MNCYVKALGLIFAVSVASPYAIAAGGADHRVGNGGKSDVKHDNELKTSGFVGLAALVVESPARQEPAQEDYREVISVRETIAIPVSRLVTAEGCANEFEVINGSEPMAKCKVIPGPAGMAYRPIAVTPWVTHEEMNTDLNGVGCTGGFVGNVASDKIEIFIALSPYRRDYSREQYADCFRFVVNRLSEQDRKLYFEAIR